MVLDNAAEYGGIFNKTEKIDQKMNPLISVIVPCYKQADLLPETLESVIAQTYQNWECVIVNDGSPDNTEEVAKLFCGKDKRFRYVYKENGGLASARNYGIQHSFGEYILPLDSDDLIGAAYMELAMKQFEAHPETKLVYCIPKKFGAENGVWDLGEYNYATMLWVNIIFCTCFYRRSDYDKTPGYNPNMKYGYEDWDFLLSLLKPEDKVYQIPEVLFFYRMKQKSMVKSIGPKMEYTLKQIGKNHPDVYAPYVSDVLWLQRMLDYYRYGLPYRIGSKLLRPYRKLKSLLTGHHYLAN